MLNCHWLSGIKHGIHQELFTTCAKCIHTPSHNINCTLSVRAMLFCAAGVHLEGPFINVSKKGAHNAAFIRSSMSPDEVERCYGDLGVVRIITLAPELPGAMETIQWLTQKKNIVVSLGMPCCNAHMLFSVGVCMSGIAVCLDAACAMYVCL